MTAPLLSVKDLDLGFGAEHGFAHVLNGVNLSIQPGEVMGLVGESGCGKTTLARAILGVLPRNSLSVRAGTIRFRDVDMLDEKDTARIEALRGRAITFVPQDPFTSLNPVFTIGDQIEDLMKWKSPRRAADGWSRALPAALQPYSRARRRQDREAILTMLESVQLPQPKALLKKYPHEVSGGQRQRLMIAMALLPEPDLIVADEPTTALDVTIQAQILGLLRTLASDRGVSVMLTTHDLGSAYEICDSVTVMYAGQNVEAAPIDSFFARPTHPYTRKLIDSLPEQGRAMEGIPGEVPNFMKAPGGCRFHPRCERATAECRERRPDPTQRAPGHQQRCYHPVLAEGEAA